MLPVSTFDKSKLKSQNWNIMLALVCILNSYLQDCLSVLWEAFRILPKDQRHWWKNIIHCTSKNCVFFDKNVKPAYSRRTTNLKELFRQKISGTKLMLFYTSHEHLRYSRKVLRKRNHGVFYFSVDYQERDNKKTDYNLSRKTHELLASMDVDHSTKQNEQKFRKSAKTTVVYNLNLYILEIHCQPA